jgi:predicted RNase H-like nuclease (RuvC/YqgF family)
MTNENAEVTESKESETQQSTPNEDKTAKVDTPIIEAKPSTSNIESDKKALQGIISAKDKKLSEVEKQQAELKAELEKFKTQTQVSKMLLKSEYPEKVKQILENKLDSLTVENLESTANELVELYNAGVESQKKSISDFVNKKPEPVMPEGFDDKVAKVTNLQDLEKLIGRG